MNDKQYAICMNLQAAAKATQVNDIQAAYKATMEAAGKLGELLITSAEAEILAYMKTKVWTT